jgi:hypothetical protein
MAELYTLNFSGRANLTAVKSFRIWLLLLLAVLLPIRGALAAGMLCQVSGFGVQTEAQFARHANAHDNAVSMSHGHQHHELSSQHQGADHDHAGGGSHDRSDAADKCNLCSAFCSVTGLVGTGVIVAEPRPVSTVFPHVYAPPVSFFPDGQERPPRTI